MTVCLLMVGALPVLAEAFNWRQFEGTTLRVLQGKTEFMPMLQKMTQDFKALTGIEVVEEYYPPDALRRKLIMELGAKNADLDVFSMQMKAAYQFEAAGWLEPLDRYLKQDRLTHPDFDFADIIPNTLPTINGQLVGMPNSANPQCLMYRKDLFAAYNLKVPTTWAELEAAAKVLQQNLPKGQFAWISRMNQENTATFSSFLHANGGSWLDTNGKPGLNSPAALEALDFYGRMAREYGPPGAATISFKEVIGAMAQGKAAMTIEVSTFATLVLENPKHSKVVGQLGYVKTPIGPSAKAGEDVWEVNLTHVSAFSQKKEAAWLFVQYMATKENYLPFKLAGTPVVRLSSWQHPQWLAKDRLPELSAFQLNALRTGKPLSDMPISKFTAARPIISRLIYTAYEGGAVAKAADETVAELSKLLEP